MSIVIQNVVKRFGSFVALSGVSLEVPDGALLALLGPSGSGKTTLLRVIAGLEVADSGSVLHQEQDITDYPARDRKVGFVFQHYALFRHMTIAENIGYGLRVRGVAKPERRERVEEHLKLIRPHAARSRQRNFGATIEDHHRFAVPPNDIHRIQPRDVENLMRARRIDDGAHSSRSRGSQCSNFLI